MEDTSHLIVVGLKHNDFDTYDPEEYDHNDPDYLDVTANEIGIDDFGKHTINIHKSFLFQKLRMKYLGLLEGEYHKTLSNLSSTVK